MSLPPVVDHWGSLHSPEASAANGIESTTPKDGRDPASLEAQQDLQKILPCRGGSRKVSRINFSASAKFGGRFSS